MSQNTSGTPRKLLHDADFRKLWAGQTISVFGTQVTILAVPVLAAVVLQVSPLEFALLGTFEFLPFVLLSLPAGVWVDRLRRRPILIAADLGRAIALLSIPVAFAVNALSIWQLYAIGFLNGCLTAFFDVAYQSYLPSLVARDQLVDGNAKLELTRTSSQRLGPGLAGVLISVLSAPFAIVADAISYALSALFLSWIRRPEPPTTPHAEGARARPSMRAEIGVGIRFVTGNGWLRAIAVSVAVSYLFGTIADSILILYLVDERGMSAAIIGLAFTIGSVGVIGGTLITKRVTDALGVGPAILLASIGASVSWLPVAAAPDALLFPGLAITIVALGFFGVIWNINAVSMRQAITPTDLRGRVNATMRFLSWLTIPIGTVLGGALGSLIGLHATIWIGALGVLLEFVPIALSTMRSIREMPGAAQDAPAAVEAG